jgi:hypothetical protein
MFSFLNENVFDCMSSSISKIEDAINGTLELDTFCHVEDVIADARITHRGNIRNSSYWKKIEEDE